MKNVSPSLKTFLDLARVHAVMNRRFDGGLAGLGLSDFLILLHLENAKDGRMRRVDLADAMGLTASGITRLLAPMEKVGLVRREADPNDARVSYVAIGKGAKVKLRDAVENAEYIAENALRDMPKKEAAALAEACDRLASGV